MFNSVICPSMDHGEEELFLGYVQSNWFSFTGYYLGAGSRTCSLLNFYYRFYILSIVTFYLPVKIFFIILCCWKEATTEIYQDILIPRQFKIILICENAILALKWIWRVLTYRKITRNSLLTRSTTAVEVHIPRKMYKFLYIKLCPPFITYKYILSHKIFTSFYVYDISNFNSVLNVNL